MTTRSSAAERRQMRLGLFLQGAGHHVAGWRHPEAESGSENFELLRRVVQTAERAKFDMVFLADGLTSGPDAHPSMAQRFEPLTLLSALAMHTTHIGLAATASTTYSEPYHLARVFASLDRLSGGRAAWNVVTTSYDRTAANFTRGNHPDHAERYEMAGEFVDVVKGLWDSWDEDAVIRDKARGVYFDPAKVHALDHEGRFFRIKGPLNASRPPQGHPVVIQAGSSGPGQDLAARIAEVVFTAQQTLEEAQVFYRDLKGRLAKFGRAGQALHVMPGVFPVIGRTEREAREKYEQLQQWIDTSGALSLLSDRLGHDVSRYPLDGPLPELPESDQLKSRAKLLTDLARRENLTLRQLYYLVAGARGHRIVWGTAGQVADALEEWFTQDAADGFNIMPPYFPGGLDDFVEQVVPELQRRGLFRTEYAGSTLREHLGLPRPASRYAVRG
ncbi:LLM class flavin-dependent oxidoreductase [Burkholderia gladioli]|uniref:LLM class flavin-dependent oxidoreductase n=1 Tax=Burkholderia gladioli TaxID=28095 RepID=A0AB38TM51_BURGA|nr:LLM class flavin-dependent oxidoreductase [Burkholderia gladioli]MBJ9663508.1 LLM class flavin-dependent oxidoreductase [Burkholderia gladioli]MBU9188794.1 LLM class flavin-dependent oxidoreductase [Burkholderia gladioli]MBU9198763.1 LLM class flavin-dependent oxidoreductase [Burkholderia gladioli]MBU9217476.1 LLM class flavin-dependent oxidoreductase [Burkholderia gladioli]MBU9269977.1 LLM class flavin-dependent oxidoreductase [Burkholderia gladioli]